MCEARQQGGEEAGGGEGSRGCQRSGFCFLVPGLPCPTPPPSQDQPWFVPSERGQIVPGKTSWTVLPRWGSRPPHPVKSSSAPFLVQRGSLGSGAVACCSLLGDGGQARQRDRSESR